VCGPSAERPLSVTSVGSHSRESLKKGCKRAAARPAPRQSPPPLAVVRRDLRPCMSDFCATPPRQAPYRSWGLLAGGALQRRCDDPSRARVIERRDDPTHPPEREDRSGPRCGGGGADAAQRLARTRRQASWRSGAPTRPWLRHGPGSRRTRHVLQRISNCSQRTRLAGISSRRNPSASAAIIGGGPHM
jgi:hypothetical protein